MSSTPDMTMNGQMNSQMNSQMNGNGTSHHAVQQVASTNGGTPNRDTTIRANPRNFVETPFVSDLIRRALSYLKAGFPVHLLGPTGSGKTTLALHIGQLLTRPIMLVYGDDEFSTSDLIGSDTGYNRRKTVDNYIHSVLKVEESVSQHWVDNRLTVACREGYTLIYDEFTRSRPEANNALLSVLAERILVLPTGRGRNGYLKVNPDFRAIFTSNPEEYIGTHRMQDALLDRMITINIPGLDYETEVAIAVAHSGLTAKSAALVVDSIREVRESQIVEHPPSVRAAIMVSRILAVNEIVPEEESDFFIQTCYDVLNLNSSEHKDKLAKIVKKLIGEGQ